jgi:peptidoglycan/xylan/chitin deacetylase (PgdA/CDA1 family)
MAWLAAARFVPISMETLIRHRAHGSSLPPRPVVITFDDGFQDCVDYAVPILQHRGFTAIFYLVADLVGKTSRWLVQERGMELPLMDWQTARQLEQMGFACGSHTLSHPRLAEHDAQRCRGELVESRRRLEDNLGHVVRHFAYPHGSMNAEVRALVAESGYASACSSRIGLSAANDDLLALHRIPVEGQDTLLDFICRLRTGRTFRAWLGHRASSLRHYGRRASTDTRT